MVNKGRGKLHTGVLYAYDINISPRPLPFKISALRGIIKFSQQTKMTWLNRTERWVQGVTPWHAGCHSEHSPPPHLSQNTATALCPIPTTPAKGLRHPNQCFTAAFRIFDHTLAVFVLDLSVMSPTGPVLLLLLLIWTPASSAVKHLSVCRQHSCGEKPASHHNLHSSNTPQLKALKWNTKREYLCECAWC